jgi:hypothetical protein
MLRPRAAVLLLLACAVARSAAAQPAPVRQAQEDDYTRYELLGPDTAQFRILYEVTGTTANAPFFFNTIRKGSIATDERVFDPATGQALKWEVVGGAQARREGHPDAALDTEYIKVYLARPVPPQGQARVVIDKTYKDPKSYFRQGDLIVFDRPLGIRRNAVVLPAGYRLVSLNVPSQILTEADGRVMISFMHPGPNAAPLIITAREGLVPRAPAALKAPAGGGGGGAHERAHDNLEREYQLGNPAEHRLQRVDDLAEVRTGATSVATTLPVGVTVVDAAALVLDTGEALKVEPGPRALTARIAAVPPGASVRVRITTTLADAARYRLDGDDLAFDATFDAPRTAVVLPAGWTVTTSSMPVVVRDGADGRQRLEYENPRPDVMAVAIRARRVK